MVIVIPPAGGKASMDQPRAQAVLFARFFRFAFIRHGWLLFRQGPPQPVQRGVRVRDFVQNPIIVQLPLAGRRREVRGRAQQSGDIELTARHKNCINIQCVA